MGDRARDQKSRADALYGIGVFSFAAPVLAVDDLGFKVALGIHALFHAPGLLKKYEETERYKDPNYLPSPLSIYSSLPEYGLSGAIWYFAISELLNGNMDGFVPLAILGIGYLLKGLGKTVELTAQSLRYKSHSSEDSPEPK